MNENLASAVFDTQNEAERAVSQLRGAGVDDSAISVIAQQDGKNTVSDGSGAETATDVVGKTALGAGAGTLLGIAALAIPGVGPFLAAGAIASVAVPGAALTGAAVGAVAGGVAGLLSDHGVDRDDADYYEERINSGGVFVSVEATGDGLSAHAVRDILYANGGHSSSRAKSDARV
ncbi:MAG: low temperature-induced protein [Pseudomonadota bacterium]|nr:low temperature-induced protein [Pseudomonadota bacterium]